MSRYIFIEVVSCRTCPHLGHTGAFTKGGAKPCCDHPTITRREPNCFKRTLNFKRDYDLGIPAPRVAVGIAKWCPLPKTKPNEESA